MTAVDVEATRLGRARANALGMDEPAGRPRRRRGRIAGGAVLLVVSAWLGAVVFLAAGRREEVVVLARHVDRFEAVEADDLQVVRVAADPEVGVISANQLDDLVGRVAATELVEGSLLHEHQLLDTDERVVGPGEAVVGAVLSPGDSPDRLSPGDVVEVVVRAAVGSTTGAQSLPGWVLSVAGAESAEPDSQRVSLVVPADSVALASAAAAEDRVSVAVLGGS